MFLRLFPALADGSGNAYRDDFDMALTCVGFKPIVISGDSTTVEVRYFGVGNSELGNSLGVPVSANGSSFLGLVCNAPTITAIQVEEPFGSQGVDDLQWLATPQAVPAMRHWAVILLVATLIIGSVVIKRRRFSK